MQIQEQKCTTWKSVELYNPQIFPDNTEDTFLELHMLSNRAEVLELARYVGKSQRITGKQRGEPKTL